LEFFNTGLTRNFFGSNAYNVPYLLQKTKEQEAEPSEPGKRALLSLKSKESGGSLF
jgi:hypothetical protein